MYDVIVIGVGSMGSSACYYLAGRGHHVLGIEQFTTPHEQGSHTGQSRIIRKAYFEDPDYVPLLNASYENWEHLELETGNKIYHRTGLVYFGPPHAGIIEGVQNSARLYHINLEQPLPSVVTRDFPQFKIPAGYVCLLEPDAGFLQPEKIIELYKQQAIKKGAVIHSNEKVMEWKKDAGHISVVTDKGQYRCKQLVMTSGVWSGQLIPALRDKIKVTRQPLAWVQPQRQNDFMMGQFPCWMIADDVKPGCYYGFPILPESGFGGPEGLKIAYHYPGAVVDPDHLTQLTSAEETNDIQYFLDKYLTDPVDSILSTKICMYANSPDENFIIDRLPGYEDNVTIACGFSGHGFKFVSVVGEILADLCMQGTTKHPIEFLRLSRFS